eukprot:gene3751-13811_t
MLWAARRASSPAVRIYGWASSMARMSTASKEEVEVIVIDPRIVLDHTKLKEVGSLKEQLSSGVCNAIMVPKAFIPLLAKGVMELGDMDDPINAWVFGHQDEIFKYSMIGTHSTQSGYTSIVEAALLRSITSGVVAIMSYTSIVEAALLRSIISGGVTDLPPWDKFRALMDAGGVSWAGLLVSKGHLPEYLQVPWAGLLVSKSHLPEYRQIHGRTIQELQGCARLQHTQLLTRRLSAGLLLQARCLPDSQPHHAAAPGLCPAVPSFNRRGCLRDGHTRPWFDEKLAVKFLTFLMISRAESSRSRGAVSPPRNTRRCFRDGHTRPWFDVKSAVKFLTSLRISRAESPRSRGAVSPPRNILRSTRAADIWVERETIIAAALSGESKLRTFT